MKTSLVKQPVAMVDTKADSGNLDMEQGGYGKAHDVEDMARELAGVQA